MPASFHSRRKSDCLSFLVESLSNLHNSQKDDSDARTVPSSDNEEEELLTNHGPILLSNLSAMINNASVRLSQSTSGVRVPTTFDKTLAAKHEYLGTDFEEVRGRTLHDEGSIVWMPILMELGVVLVPGQTIPLTVFYPPTISMFREVVAKDKTFGVMCVNTAAPYGTTAEIYQYQEDTEVAGFKIKAKGRQRFKLLDENRKTPGILFGKVLILPEITMAGPLHSSRFTSLDRFRSNCNVKGKLSGIDAAPTTWPSWVYRQYDVVYLVKKVTEKLKSLKTEEYSAVLPTDPVDLSYWVAQCMPINGQQRLKMLSFNTAIERLQYASEILTEGDKLYCHRCGNFIAHRKDVFSMSTEGPQSMYCNPGGYVHEIITVNYASGMMLVGDNPSTEYSWFPGYAWTISQCSDCDCHMGWLFTATKAGLRPSKFWGLSRKSVTVNRKIL